MITHNGETMCVTDWAIRAGMNRATFKQRIDYGWPMEKAHNP